MKTCHHRWSGVRGVKLQVEFSSPSTANPGHHHHHHHHHHHYRHHYHCYLDVWDSLWERLGGNDGFGVDDDDSYDDIGACSVIPKSVRLRSCLGKGHVLSCQSECLSFKQIRLNLNLNLRSARETYCTLASHHSIRHSGKAWRFFNCQTIFKDIIFYRDKKIAKLPNLKADQVVCPGLSTLVATSMWQKDRQGGISHWYQSWNAEDKQRPSEKDFANFLQKLSAAAQVQDSFKHMLLVLEILR